MKAQPSKDSVTDIEIDTFLLEERSLFRLISLKKDWEGEMEIPIAKSDRNFNLNPASIAKAVAVGRDPVHFFRV